MIRWSHPELDVDLPAPLVDHAIAREHIEAGVSTAMLERLQLPGGRVLVSKHVTPKLDWMMRATRDRGRSATLWVDGTMARCPPQIDPALVRIEDDGADGWWLYMRDVAFHPRGKRFDLREVRRVLETLAALHAEFWEEEVPGLCALGDLLRLLAPKTIAGFDTQFLAHVRGGWETFAALAPPDVGDPVLVLLDDPQPLVGALGRTETTMLHADVHFANAVLEPDRLVLIDWTLATQGPPAVDFVWFLDQSIELIDATHDEVVEEFLRAEDGRVSRDALDVAILSELLSSGWQCRDWVDADDRAERQASFDWFVAGARRGLALL